MPYTAFHVSHPLWLLILISGWSVPFTMLSVRIRGQIWHFGEQKVSVFSSLVLNILLCLPCTKISPRFRSLLNTTIGGALKIVFIQSDLWSKFRCFFVILWISGNCLAYVITNGARSFVFFCFRYYGQITDVKTSTADRNAIPDDDVKVQLTIWCLHQWRQSNADCLRCRLCNENWYHFVLLTMWSCSSKICFVHLMKASAETLLEH